MAAHVRSPTVVRPRAPPALSGFDPRDFEERLKISDDVPKQPRAYLMGKTNKAWGRGMAKGVGIRVCPGKGGGWASCGQKKEMVLA